MTATKFTAARIAELRALALLSECNRRGTYENRNFSVALPAALDEIERLQKQNAEMREFLERVDRSDEMAESDIRDYLEPIQ